MPPPVHASPQVCNLACMKPINPDSSTSVCQRPKCSRCRNKFDLISGQILNCTVSMTHLAMLLPRPLYFDPVLGICCPERLNPGTLPGAPEVYCAAAYAAASKQRTPDTVSLHPPAFGIKYVPVQILVVWQTLGPACQRRVFLAAPIQGG